MIVSREICGSAAVLSVVAGLFLASCSSDNKAPVVISPPEAMREIQAVDGTQVYAEISVNNGAAQTFSFNSTSPTPITLSGVNLGQDNQITISWFETFEGGALPLATQQGEFFADPQTLTATISLNYNFQFDSDNDNTVNLEERVNGTCPLVTCNSTESNSTPITILSDYIPPVMKAIPAGEFVMGSDDPLDRENEAPARTVQVNAFYLSESEVTWDEWNVCVNAGGCDTSLEEKDWLTNLTNKGQHPVGGISWDQIQEYITWINLTDSDFNYRLPTEAEFEYALRAGVSSRYAYGDDGDAFCDFANGPASASCSDGYRYSAPVKSYSPNGYGLYDMNGNVDEWVLDCSHSNYIDAPATSEAWLDTEPCGNGVLRGGNWSFVPADFRITARRVGKTRHPDWPEEYEGFRLAAD